MASVGREVLLLICNLIFSFFSSPFSRDSKEQETWRRRDRQDSWRNRDEQREPGRGSHWGTKENQSATKKTFERATAPIESKKGFIKR